DRTRFEREAELAWRVYNEAWEDNWGFVPMSRAEFDHMAGTLRLLLREQVAYFAEVDGEPAALAVALPDYNLALQRNPGGRLLPFGLLRLLHARTRLPEARLMMLGVRAQYRRLGVHLMLIDKLV